MGQSVTSEVLKQANQLEGSANSNVSFTSGDCHTLAYALWLANNMQGKFLACMLITSSEGKFIEVSYGHMVYEDIDGQTWDIDGENALERYSDMKIESHEQECERMDMFSDECDDDGCDDDGCNDEEFEHDALDPTWVEVAPENLGAFLADWGATRPISPQLVEHLLESSSMPKNVILTALTAVDPSRPLPRNFGRAPYTDKDFREIASEGFVNQEILDGIKKEDALNKAGISLCL